MNKNIITDNRPFELSVANVSRTRVGQILPQRPSTQAVLLWARTVAEVPGAHALWASEQKVTRRTT